MNRRRFLSVGAAAFLAAAAEEQLLAGTPPAQAPAAGVQEVAPGVFFFEKDAAKTGSNSGWVVFEDYVLVIDASFPSGARLVLSAIRAITDKPVRFAFDTHHHGDHAYGNQVLAAEGATPVAHVGALEEMRRLETGQYGGAPGRWESEAKEREDLRSTRLKPPSLLFPSQLFFDDGKQRVELVHFGAGHTRGDALAWLPNQRVLFSGDMCVNGAYNFVGDGDVGSWIKTLDAPRKLGVRVLCPGHGPRGTAALLEDQQAYFRALVALVNARLVKPGIQDATALIEPLRATITANPQIARYASGTRYDPFAAHVEKVYEELTGRKLRVPAGADARQEHARAHGHA